MFEKFSDYMFSLLFTPLKKVRQAGNQFYLFFKVVGKLFDNTKADIFRVREESIVASASEAMLPEHGRDRNMTRLKGETVEGYRTRLSMKALIAEKAGTTEGIRLSIAALGYQYIYLQPCSLFDPSRWAETVIWVELPESSVISDRRIILMEANKVKPASAKLILNSFDRISIQTKNQLSFLQFTAHAALKNYYATPIRFDGSLPFQGEIQFDQQVVDHFHLNKLRIHANSLEHSLKLENHILIQNHICTTNCLNLNDVLSCCFKARSNLNNQIRYKQNFFTRETESVCLIINTLYTFNASYTFNGSRRFNANVIKEEL